MYKDKNLVLEGAAYECVSPIYYPNNNITLNHVSKSHLPVRILAVRCNTIVECYNGLDEVDCQKDILNYSYLVLVLVLLTGTSILLQNALEKFVRRFDVSGDCIDMRGDNENDLFLKHLLHCHTKADMLKLKITLEERHSSKNMEDVNLSMAALQNMEAMDRKERGRLNKLFYETEVKVHNGNLKL